MKNLEVIPYCNTLSGCIGRLLKRINIKTVLPHPRVWTSYAICYKQFRFGVTRDLSPSPVRIDNVILDRQCGVLLEDVWMCPSGARLLRSLY